MVEPHTSRDWIYDQLEPKEDGDYRAAARLMVEVMNRVMIHILKGNARDVRIWGVAYAMGLDMALLKPMDDVARTIGVGRAAISKEAKEAQHQLSLPPSLAQKSATACASYHTIRMSQLR
jgi:hypothetical protein